LLDAEKACFVLLLKKRSDPVTGSVDILAGYNSDQPSSSRSFFFSVFAAAHGSPDDTELGPQLGAKELPIKRPRETDESWHSSPQPSRDLRKRGAAPLSGAEDQIARALSAYAQYVCLFYFFANGGV
jgi:hypothetical protein